MKIQKKRRKREKSILISSGKSETAAVKPKEKWRETKYEDQRVCVREMDRAIEKVMALFCMTDRIHPSIAAASRMS